MLEKGETEVQHAFPADICFDFGPVKNNGRETASPLQCTNRKKQHIHWIGENTFQQYLTSKIITNIRLERKSLFLCFFQSTYFYYKS